MGQHSALIAASVVAVAAAIRSAWSPCSLSMLSMLTPFGEQSRGNRYSIAAGTFIAAAVLGGICLGALPAVAAFAIGRSGVATTTIAAVATGTALLAIAADLGALPLPRVPRQVNESWFGQYRAWVYGIGYGWQLGAGLTTYVMTAGIYLMVVLAALTGSMVMAVGVCAGFGALRGFTILLGARIADTDALRRLHGRLDHTEPTSRAIAVLGQVAAASIGLAGIAPLWAVALAAIVLLAAMRFGVRAMPSRQASAA